jgi:ubiquinone biosynthesis protein COQ4
MNQIPGLNIESYLKFALDPLDTQTNFDLQKDLIKSSNRAETIRHLAQACQNSPELVSLFEKKYMKPMPTTAELLDMPQGTLGHQVGAHLKRHNIHLDFAGLDANVFYDQELTLATYFGIRALRNHDVLHALLNRDISPLSEYYIFAFQIAQFQSPLHVVSLSAGILGSMLSKAEDPSILFAQICEGFTLGKKAKFIFGFPLEDHWMTPIEDVRKSLNLEGIPAGDPC